MNTRHAARIETLCVLAVAIALAISVRADDTSRKDWTNYFNRAVAGELQTLASTNQVLRYGVETNVSAAFKKDQRWLRSISESSIPTMGHVRVKTMEFDAETAEQSQRVRIRVVEGVNSRDEAMNGLAHLMSSSTSMGGRPYKEFQAGIGDVCFIFNVATKAGAGPSTLFFCRDNIAVEVTSYSPQTDIAALARLIDTSIMASPEKGAGQPPGEKTGSSTVLETTNAPPANPNPAGK